MHEFATGLENATSGPAEARQKFWSLVEGDHEDQIYIHQGHIEMENLLERALINFKIKKRQNPSLF